MTLFEWLIQRYPQASRQTLRRMVEDGRVAVGGKRARSLKVELAADAAVEVADRPVAPPASIKPLGVLHEDADVLVVFKPAGLLTSTVPRERRPTAAAIMRAYLAGREPSARLGIIHRLDQDASGLLVFSKNDPAYANLKRQFFHHTVDRDYIAVAHGRPKEPAGRIESFLVEHADGSVHPTRNRRKGQEAISEYRTLATVDDPPRAVLRVSLHTGRKHQIRAHLASIGHPIVGDDVYGEKPEPHARLMLSAILLAFDHPRTGERLTFEIPPPREIAALLPDSPSSQDTEPSHG